jgi:hypothetical protein
MPFSVSDRTSRAPDARIPVGNLVLGREGVATRADAEASLPQAAGTLRSFGQPVPGFQVVEAEDARAAMAQVAGIPFPPHAPGG